MKFFLNLAFGILFSISFGFASYDTTDELSENEKWDYVREIDRTGRTNTLFRITRILNIGLQGNYTEEDSLTVMNVITDMDTVLENIKVIHESQQRPYISIIFRPTDDRSGEKRLWWKYDIGGTSSIETNLFRIRDYYIIRINTDSTSQMERNNIIQNCLYYLTAGLPIIRVGKYPESIFHKGFLGLNDLNKVEIHDIDRFVVKKLYSEKIVDRYKRFSLPVHFELFFGRWDARHLKILIILSVLYIILIWIIKKVRLDQYFKSKINSRWIRQHFIGQMILCLILISDFLSIYLNYRLDIQYYIDFLSIFALPLTIFMFVLIGLFQIKNQYVLTRIRLFHLNLFIDLFSTAVCFVITNIFLFQLIFTSYSKQYLPGYIVLGILVYHCYQRYKTYNIQIALKEKELEITKLTEQKTKAELDALHSRINPHFLYNALNSLAGLAHENAGQTEKMALALSKLFRYNINKENETYTTLKEEMEMTRTYLEIEKMRFNDKLDFVLEITPDLENMQIPRFLIQPLVENSIKHGLSKITKKGVVIVSVKEQDSNLVISVQDNGPAFPEDLLSGYGLQSIYDKLDLLYSDRYKIQFNNGDEKNITITLELSNKQKEK
jgi:sensor histidine kinase YesM